MKRAWLCSPFWGDAASVCGAVGAVIFLRVCEVVRKRRQKCFLMCGECNVGFLGQADELWRG